MKRIVFLATMILALAAPEWLFAKSETAKIVIQGADLKTPIKLTDRKVLAKIKVWSGPGTTSSVPGFDPKAPSFIVDWSQGPIPEPPKELSHYQVSFYADMPNERLVYVVSYVFDPATGHGYVYLPGKNDKDYRLNVSAILRGVEGNWFHSSSQWDEVAKPLIQAPVH